MDESSGRERPRREREANGARLSMATGPGSEAKTDDVGVQDGAGIDAGRIWRLFIETRE